MLLRRQGRSSFDPAPPASPAAIREEVAQLASRIRNGDPAAESVLVERVYPRVLVMLIARTRDRDAARDLAQEVMMDVLAAVRRGQLEDPANLVAFVYGIARNVAHDHFRERRRRLRDVPLDLDLRAAGQPDRVAAADLGRVVRLAVRQLDRIDRAILNMVYVREMSAVEIGPELGLTPESVRQRKSRALARLRAACHEAVRPRDILREALDG